MSVVQLLAYALIGLTCGVCGVLFVHANAKWMAFRKSHAHTWPLRYKYVWSSALIGAWAFASFPDGPFGHFLSKGQTASIDALFTNRLGPEWTFPRSQADSPFAALVLYVILRLSFLALGITLPLPCGVFAPCLAIGAGIGRAVNELMQVSAKPYIQRHLTTPMAMPWCTDKLSAPLISVIVLSPTPQHTSPSHQCCRLSTVGHVWHRRGTLAQLTTATLAAMQ
jgi:H+/Cl- antiporter ClcA